MTTDNEILTTCALRFDGYKYQEKFPNYSSKESIDKLLKGETLEGLEPLATFFYLQRGLNKWDLVREPENSRFYKIYRALFFLCVDAEIPAEYKNSEYIHKWQTFNVDDAKKLVKENDDNTKYLT